MAATMQKEMNWSTAYNTSKMPPVYPSRATTFSSSLPSPPPTASSAGSRGEGPVTAWQKIDTANASVATEHKIVAVTWMLAAASSRIEKIAKKHAESIVKANDDKTAGGGGGGDF